MSISDKAKSKISSIFENGEHLIGDLLNFGDDEVQEIIKEASDIFDKLAKTQTKVVDDLFECELLVIAVILATKRMDQSDENGWLKFLAKVFLNDDYNSFVVYPYPAIRNCFARLGSEGKLLLSSRLRKKYYATACCHALYPKTSIFAFFDLCWGMFVGDFDYDYEGLNKNLKLIYQCLISKFENVQDNTDIKFGSQFYALRVGLTSLATEHRDVFLSLVDRSAKNIDSLLDKSQMVNRLGNLDDLELEWWNDKRAKFGVQKRRRANIERTVDGFSSVNPTFIIAEGEAYLHIPRVRLPSGFDNVPWIEVENGGTQMLAREMPIGGCVLSSTDSIDIPLDKLIADGQLDIEVRITLNGNAVYDSGKSLRRQFVLFDEKGKELTSTKCDPGSYLVFLPSLYGAKLTEEYKINEHHIYWVKAKVGEIVKRGDKVVIFASKDAYEKAHFVGDEVKGVSFVMDGESYDVLSGDLHLFVDQSINEKDFGLKIGKTIKRLSDFKISNSSSGPYYTLAIERGKPISVELFRFSNNRIEAKYNFIAFSNISIKFDKGIYFGENARGEAQLRIDNQIIQTQFIVGEDAYEPFGIGKFKIIPPVFEYAFNDGEYVHSESNPAYVDEITEGLLLKIKCPSPYKVMLSNNTSIGGEDGVLEFGKAIEAIRGSKSRSISCFAVCENEKIDICTVYLKPWLAGNPLTVDAPKKKIYLDFSSFVGPKDPAFAIEILNQLGKVKKRFDFITKKDEELDLHDLPTGKYKISISLIDFFETLKILEPNDVFIGNTKDERFVGTMMEIEHAYSFNNALPKKISPFYVCHLRYACTDYWGFDYYKGRLAIMLSGQIYYRDFLKDKEGNKVDLSNIYVKLLPNNKAEIGFGELDTDYYSIDGEFCIDDKGKLSVDASKCAFTPNNYVYTLKKER